MIAALTWITVLVLRMEAAAQHEASVRLALYRMDFWLSPRIGRERLRPYFEYLPFYAQQRAYTRILHEIEPGEVITPSPLLTFDSDVFLLHFQVAADGTVSSPQVPEGNWRDLAEGGGLGGAYLAPGVIEGRAPLLARVRTLLPVQARLDACVLGAETMIADLIGVAAPAPTPATQILQSLPGQTLAFDGVAENASQQPSQSQSQQWASGMQQRGQVQSSISKADIARRAASNYQQQLEETTAPPQTAQVFIVPQKGAAVINVESVQVDELVPVWLSPNADPDAKHDRELVLLRRVRIGDETLYQGVLCDWNALRGALIEQISDLFPNAQLLAEPQPSPALLESGRLLGSVPATLETSPPRITWNGMGGLLLSPARTTLALAWLAVIGAIIAAGITLRSSIHFGEKRSRFASAVTHELRTPLTTFRMYSEMLADGMVRDEAQRQTYLRTLQQESGRLSTLVENVLSYARLEEGRAARHMQALTADDLIGRVRGVLQRRAEDAGMQLEISNHVGGDGASSQRFTTDAEVVEQILFNLIDNACKYAADGEDKRIEIVLGEQADRLTITVRDHGPGISPEHERAIFKAFERGAHGPGDTIPGVGLGLALSRGLARDLGGELTLEHCEGCGACFMLTLGA